MGLPIQLTDGVTGVNLQTVDSSGAAHVVPERLPFTNPANVGAVNRMKLMDTGLVTGAPLIRSGGASLAGRDYVGLDNVLDFEVFNYTSQNTNKHSYTSSTMTMALASQALKTNATGITTLNTYAILKTFRYFPVYGNETNTTIEYDAAVSSSLAAATNTNVYLGILLPNNGGVPLDGIYFKFTNAGIYGVANYNGTETSVVGPFLAAAGGATFYPTIGQVLRYKIIVNDARVEFWINDVLYGVANTPAGQGQPCMASSLPWTVVHAIGGTAAGAVFSLQISDYVLLNNDLAWNKPVNIQAIDAGGNSASAQQGATQGQLSTYALGAAPGALTWTASTAPATNTKGGKWTIASAWPTPGESDYPLFAWQNPAGTVSAPGKTYYVDSINFEEMWVLTTLVGGPFIAEFGVGIGSTAASLATTESGSFSSGTTKIARKETLFTQALAAAAVAGAIAPGRQIMFPSPLPIQPGEYLHIIVRFQGVILTSGALRAGVQIGGFFL